MSVRLHWNGFAVHPCVDFSAIQPPFAAPASLLKTADQETSEQGVGKEYAGGKICLSVTFVLFQCQDKKQDAPWGQRLFPPAAGLEPWRSRGLTGLEISAELRPPGCPGA